MEHRLIQCHLQPLAAKQLAGTAVIDPHRILLLKTLVQNHMPLQKDRLIGPEFLVQGGDPIHLVGGGVVHQQIPVVKIIQTYLLCQIILGQDPEPAARPQNLGNRQIQSLQLTLFPAVGIQDAAGIGVEIFPVEEHAVMQIHLQGVDKCAAQQVIHTKLDGPGILVHIGQEKIGFAICCDGGGVQCQTAGCNLCIQVCLGPGPGIIRQFFQRFGSQPQLCKVLGVVPPDGAFDFGLIRLKQAHVGHILAIIINESVTQFSAVGIGHDISSQKLHGVRALDAEIAGDAVADPKILSLHIPGIVALYILTFCVRLPGNFQRVQIGAHHFRLHDIQSVIDDGGASAAYIALFQRLIQGGNQQLFVIAADSVTIEHQDLTVKQGIMGAGLVGRVKVFTQIQLAQQPAVGIHNFHIALAGGDQIPIPQCGKGTVVTNLFIPGSLQRQNPIFPDQAVHPLHQFDAAFRLDLGSALPDIELLCAAGVHVGGVGE